VVSVAADAGLGKSRLVAEFLALLDREGHLATARVLRVTCSSLGEQTYGVFAGFLREAYGIAPGERIDSARRKLAEGARAIGAGAAQLDVLAPVLGHFSASRRC
jgi:adenylate cyclase